MRERNRLDFFQGEIFVLLEGLISVRGSKLIWAGRKSQLILRKAVVPRALKGSCRLVGEMRWGKINVGTSANW